MFKFWVPLFMKHNLSLVMKHLAALFVLFALLLFAPPTSAYSIMRTGTAYSASRHQQEREDPDDPPLPTVTAKRLGSDIEGGSVSGLGFYPGVGVLNSPRKLSQYGRKVEQSIEGAKPDPQGAKIRTR